MRGIGASFFWSEKGNARFYSRRDREQIDLSAISSTPIGGQAVVPAWRCGKCDLVIFSSAGDEAQLRDVACNVS